MSSRPRAFSLVIYGFDTQRPPHGPCPPSNHLVSRQISDNDAALPEQVLEMRARLQLFKDLREEHPAWVGRVPAIRLHRGPPAIAGDLLGADNRRRLAAGEQLSPAGRQAVATALRILDALDPELVPLRN